MDERAEVHVAMGDLQVVRHGETLVALLGSCVAIALLWRAGGRCAMAHCLLPSGPGSAMRIGGRYVDQAVPSLIRLLGITEADKGDVEVVLTGGASMLRSTRVAGAVGKLNIAAACEALEAHGLSITHMDVGGRRGRQVRIDTRHYQYAVKTIDNAVDHSSGKEQEWGHAFT
jgi:chemotaxis protein CheD